MYVCRGSDFGEVLHALNHLRVAVTAVFHDSSSGFPVRRQRRLEYCFARGQALRGQRVRAAVFAVLHKKPEIRFDVPNDRKEFSVPLVCPSTRRRRIRRCACSSGTDPAWTRPSRMPVDISPTVAACSTASLTTPRPCGSLRRKTSVNPLAV